MSESITPYSLFQSLCRYAALSIALPALALHGLVQLFHHGPEETFNQTRDLMMWVFEPVIDDE